MRLFLILTSFFSLSLEAAETHLNYDCKVVKLHYIKAKKNINRNEAICVHKINAAMISPSCLIRKCDIFKQLRETKAKPKLTSFGTPDHRLCHDIGGLPQVIDYKWSGKNVEQSRCLSKADGSFIDTETLMAVLAQ